MSNTEQVSRRRAIGTAIGAGVTVAAGIGGYLVAARSPAAHPTTDPKAPEYQVPGGGTSGGSGLAAVDDIPDGGGLVLADRKLVLTRAGSTVHCFTAVCTHQQCLVNSVADGAIRCPCHGSAFDVNTGAVVAGPAPAPLAVVPIVVKDGQVLTS